MPPVQSRPSGSPDIGDVDALITKAIHCLRTGQPNVAALYMGKGRSILREARPNRRAEVAVTSVTEVMRTVIHSVIDELVRPFTDIIEALSPQPNPADLIRRNFETSRTERQSALAFDTAIADGDFAAAAGILGMPQYDFGGHLPAGPRHVQNTSSKPIIVHANHARPAGGR